MKRIDGRKLSHEALEGIRLQAVRAVVYRKDMKGTDKETMLVDTSDSSS